MFWGSLECIFLAHHTAKLTNWCSVVQHLIFKYIGDKNVMFDELVFNFSTKY